MIIIFRAVNFVFDGVNSSKYGLVISELDFNASTEVTGIADLTIETYTARRNNKHHMIGFTEDEIMTFSMSFNSVGFVPIDRRYLSEINTWLFNQPSYKKLQILQRDLNDVFFMCRLVSVQQEMLNDEIIGFKCTVECDNNCAYEHTRTITYDLSDNETTKTFVFNNRSTSIYGLKPTIEFTLSEGTGLTINNTTTGVQTVFTGLQQLDTITMDNENQIITAESGNNVSDCFNCNFVNLKRGLNTLVITGKCSSFTLQYQNQRKVGG